ncbi:MAG: MBL fold metallo-hydrolase [Candidatus Diapherotrites archaeon]
MEIGSIELTWLGHAGFRIKGEGLVIYIDPFQIDEPISEEEKADIILITHDHYDHCSPKDIQKISKDKTQIVCNKTTASKLKTKTTVISTNEEKNILGVKIKAVPAYNIGKSFHPKDSGVGFVIEISGKRIYHAGDTDLIPEMHDLKNIDVALLPVGGTYTMNAEEATRAAEIIKPKLAIPMHYGSIVGTRKDAQLFKELYSGHAQILNKNQ